MFKICVIGCGYMAKAGHGPAFRKYAAEHEGIVLAGCCDIKAEAAAEFAAAFGFQRSYTDYRVMLDEIKPDVVSLLSPVALTSALAVDILRMGYPLILEKPPGRNKSEILAIDEAAREAGVSVRTAFNRRYTPLVKKLKELIGHERILNITYQMYRSGRRDPDFSTTSIHAIDAVRFIADSSYQCLSLTFQELPEAGDGVANIYINGETKSGAVVQLSLVPMGGTIAERISVNTDMATYYVELPFWKNHDSPGSLLRVVGMDITHRITGDTLVTSTEMFEESGFYEENSSFFDHLRSGGATINDTIDGLQPVEIADCIRRRIKRYVADENTLQSTVV